MKEVLVDSTELLGGMRAVELETGQELHSAISAGTGLRVYKTPKRNTLPFYPNLQMCRIETERQSETVRASQSETVSSSEQGPGLFYVL